MAKNLYEAFAGRARKNPGGIVIQWKTPDGWEEVTCGRLDNDIKALSSALFHQYGIKRGDKAAILLGNRPEWPLVFFALMNIGVIVVPVNSQGATREIENILTDSGCGIAFTESGSPPIGIRTVSVDADEFKKSLQRLPETVSYEASKRDDIACIMYTSGTTANPKGVMLSHGNFLSNIHSLYSLGLLNGGDGVVAALPLHHNYSLAATMLAPIIYGGKVIFPGSIRSKEVMTAIRESNASLFIGVPLVFEMLHKAITDSFKKMPAPLSFVIGRAAGILYIIRQKTRINLSRYLFYKIHCFVGVSIRVCMCGGARLKEDIEKDMFKFGFVILNGYGLTEASPVLTVNPLKNPKIGSVGLPIANVTIEIRDKDENGIGEIFAKGPNIMKGYYKNDLLTQETIVDGWLRTGDIGRVDEDGYLYLLGRTDDAIALATGISVSPDELEEVYSFGTHVKEICIFDVAVKKGMRDTSVLWAVAVPDVEFFKKEGIVNPYSIMKKAFEKVSGTIGIPERLMGFSLTLDTLPRTIMGKVKRREVKRLYSSGGITEAFVPKDRCSIKTAFDIARSPEISKAIDCIAAQTDVKRISPDDSFEIDLGIDILGRAELAYEIERRIGIKISEDKMNSFSKIGELIDFVTHAMPGHE